MPTRRQFIRTGLWAMAGAPVATALYAWRIEPHWLAITRRELPVVGLPPALEGRTLVQLSDLHVGPKVDDEYVVRTFRRVAALEPDFVVVTGDWITWRGAGQFDQLARVLEHLPHGRLGTLGILGNHDYGFGWRMAAVGDRVAAIVGAAGVTLLRNQRATIQGLTFAGLDDFWGPHFAPGPVLGGLTPRTAAIVLSHNPDTADEPIWGDYAGWILAGHTHGGQCKPPFLPPPLLPVRNRRYTSGVFEVGRARRLFISRGVGHLIRLRFNVRPEATLFRLTPAPPGSPAP